MFFFNDTATTEIYTLSLHDALPIWHCELAHRESFQREGRQEPDCESPPTLRRGMALRHSPSRHQSSSLGGAAPRSASSSDRKSTRLNSSHANISYAVFCLKKKKKC